MQTIGERLEEARKKKGISIREAAEATKIRGDYLQKFESNHFDIGLTEIYTRGFLRTYSNFLKLPADRIINDYAALGRGDVRPRQPAREVYGRMDITVASSAPGEERATPAEEPTPAPPEPSHANRGPARPRTGSSLPTGPDPAIVFKYVKWGGIALVGLVAILVAWSLLSNSRKTPSPSTTGSGTSGTSTSTTATPRGPTFGLVSTSPIQVRVHRANPDGTDGEQLFSGQLTPNQVQPVAWPGDVFIESSAMNLLFVEVNGKRYPMGLAPGADRGKLPGPTPAQR